MPHPDETLVIPADPDLKAAFAAAVAEMGEPADDVLRHFMRLYQRDRARAAEAREASRFLAERAADPTSDEAEVMRLIEKLADTEGWTA